jgi:hypothetical protein
LCIEEIEWLKNPTQQQQACFIVFFSGIQHTYVHATRFERSIFHALSHSDFQSRNRKSVNL